jgi:hypothetical protein
MTILLPLFPVTVLQLHETSVEEIDIDTGFSATDLISLSLPEFPADDIDFADSYLDLTSHPDGDFVQGPTAGVRWDLAEEIPSGTGDAQLEFRRSRILGINKKQVTGVRLRIATTDSMAGRHAIRRRRPGHHRYAHDCLVQYGSYGGGQSALNLFSRKSPR